MQLGGIKVFKKKNYKVGETSKLRTLIKSGILCSQLSSSKINITFINVTIMLFSLMCQEASFILSLSKRKVFLSWCRTECFTELLQIVINLMATWDEQGIKPQSFHLRIYMNVYLWVCAYICVCAHIKHIYIYF